MDIRRLHAMCYIWDGVCPRPLPGKHHSCHQLEIELHQMIFQGLHQMRIQRIIQKGIRRKVVIIIFFSIFEIIINLNLFTRSLPGDACCQKVKFFFCENSYLEGRNLVVSWQHENNSAPIRKVNVPAPGLAKLAFTHQEAWCALQIWRFSKPILFFLTWMDETCMAFCETICCR